MKINVRAWCTDIYPTDEEVIQLCKPGSEDTCAFLLMAPTGWECCCLHRPMTIVERLRKGTMNAKREGCDFVNTLNVQALGLGERVIEVPHEDDH